MQIPIAQKINNTNKFLIERVLPDIGSVFVQKGDRVEPFSRVGETKISNFMQKIDKNLTLTKSVNSFIAKGVEIGEQKISSFKKKKVYAPYNGFIRSVGDGTYLFEQEKLHYTLLSGVWGEVQEVVENKAVLIQAPSTIVYCAVSTPFDAEGELVVLPNPSELLEDPYFNNFTKEVAGKIIYSGYFIKLENLKRAIELGVKGIIAGGCDKVSLDYAKQKNFALMSISGYGRIPTPVSIYDLFNSVSNRYIFLRGKAGELYIPADSPFLDSKEKAKKDFFVELKNDMIVQILERPYFGWMGVVESFDDSKISVRLLNGVEVITVMPTNLLSLGF